MKRNFKKEVNILNFWNIQFKYKYILWIPKWILGNVFKHSFLWNIMSSNLEHTMFATTKAREGWNNSWQKRNTFLHKSRRDSREISPAMTFARTEQTQITRLSIRRFNVERPRLIKKRNTILCEYRNTIEHLLCCYTKFEDARRNRYFAIYSIAYTWQNTL